MGKDNRKVLSPSGLTRGSTSNQLALLFNLDSRVKPENDSNNKRDGVWVVVKPEGDVIKRVPENDNTFVKGCHGWKRSGGAAVAMMSLSLVFCLGASEALAQCAVPPTCESLGYNKTAAQCANAETLKCPFDTSKVFCNPDYTANAKVGDIYYSDGTISDSVIAGKTPVGVVAYSNGKGGFVISLAETSAYWSTPSYTKLSCLPNLDSNGATADMNGKTNTACILSEKSSGNTYPAAEYCNNYKPVSSGKGSTGWYLPAAGELKMISLYYSALNISLQRLSKTQLSSNWYWSSSDFGDAWVVRPSDSYMYYYRKDSRSLPVRCVLAF